MRARPLPQAVAELLAEANDAHFHEIAGLLYRKAIDAAIRAYDPIIYGDLASRIMQLAAEEKIPQDLALRITRLKVIRLSDDSELASEIDTPRERHEIVGRPPFSDVGGYKSHWRDHLRQASSSSR